MFSSFLLVIITLGFAAGIYMACASAVSKNSVREFFLYGERLQLGFLVSSLLAANLSLGNLVYVCASLGYFAGWSGVFWVVATIVFLFVGFLTIGPRLKTYIQQKGNFGTIHDFISKSHQSASGDGFKRLKITSGAISCFALFMAIVIELHLGTLLIAPLVGLPQVIIVIVVILIVSFYTISSGFHSVVYTDFAQCVFLAAAIMCGLTFLLSFNSPGSVALHDVYKSDLNSILFNAGWPTAVGLTVLGLFWLISTLDTWQRNCATRSMDTSLKGALLSSILLVGSVSAFSFIGMLVKAKIEPTVSGSAVALLSKGNFPINDIFLADISTYPFGPYLLAIFAAGLLMAAISTMDTFIIVIAHVMNTDLGMADKRLRSFEDITPGEDEALVYRGRLIIAFIVIGVFIAWGVTATFRLLNQPLTLFFITYTIQFILGVPVIAGTFKITQSSTMTLFVIIASAAAIIAAGGLLLYDDNMEIFGLKGQDSLSLLPVVPVGIGVISYGALCLKRIIARSVLV